MRRREFIAGLGAAAWPFAAGAQQQSMPTIGWLSGRSAPIDALVLPAFRRALNAQGYAEGRNVTIEYRYADGHADRLPALAADLVRSRVAVIVSVGDGGFGTQAIQMASTTTPIVDVFGVDPVKMGYVQNFSRPGGNVTGVVVLQGDVEPKRLGLLHDLLPRATTFAVLLYSGFGFTGARRAAFEEELRVFKTDFQEVSRALGLQTNVLKAGTEGEIDEAFASLSQTRPDALFVSSAPFFFAHRDQLLRWEKQLALPTSYFRREFVAGGGLMSYSSNVDDRYRVVGEYVGRILKGEKAGDLPIQGPTKFELIFNLKTAKVLGLTIPETLLATADELIE